MNAHRPVVWLLSGLPGTGKTTFALALEQEGVIRLSVDDQMTSLHGRIGKDYPDHQHLTLLAPVIERVRRQLVDLVRAGRAVVLDHGLGRRVDRDDYKQLVTEHGGTWRLVTFQLDRDELLQRLSKRNEDPAHGMITPEVLDWITAGSEPPQGEGEELPLEQIRGHGQPASAAGSRPPTSHAPSTPNSHPAVDRRDLA